MRLNFLILIISSLCNLQLAFNLNTCMYTYVPWEKSLRDIGHISFVKILCTNQNFKYHLCNNYLNREGSQFLATWRNINRRKMLPYFITSKESNWRDSTLKNKRKTFIVIYTKKSQRIKKKSNITALKHLPSYKKLLKKRPTSHLDSGGDNIHYKLLQSPIIKDRGSFQIKTKESTTDQPLCVCSHP